MDEFLGFSGCVPRQGDPCVAVSRLLDGVPRKGFLPPATRDQNWAKMYFWAETLLPRQGFLLPRQGCPISTHLGFLNMLKYPNTLGMTGVEYGML